MTFTSPTCLVEYDTLVKLMPRFMARITCPSCDGLLAAKQDFRQGFHASSCKTEYARGSDDQSLFDIL